VRDTAGNCAKLIYGHPAQPMVRASIREPYIDSLSFYYLKNDTECFVPPLDPDRLREFPERALPVELPSKSHLDNRDLPTKGLSGKQRGRPEKYEVNEVNKETRNIRHESRAAIPQTSFSVVVQILCLT